MCSPQPKLSRPARDALCPLVKSPFQSPKQISSPLESSFFLRILCHHQPLHTLVALLQSLFLHSPIALLTPQGALDALDCIDFCLLLKSVVVSVLDLEPRTNYAFKNCLLK